MYLRANEGEYIYVCVCMRLFMFKYIFFLCFYSPIQALAASIKLYISLQLLDLG
jgi:hypothetical protein